MATISELDEVLGPVETGANQGKIGPLLEPNGVAARFGAMIDPQSFGPFFDPNGFSDEPGNSGKIGPIFEPSGAPPKLAGFHDESRFGPIIGPTG